MRSAAQAKRVNLVDRDILYCLRFWNITAPAFWACVCKECPLHSV